MQTTDKLIECIQDSPSPYHAATAAAAWLEAAGSARLEGSAPWALSPSQCCYATRNQSSLITFRLPDGTPKDWRMTAAHSGSSTFYVKDDTLEENEHYVRLAVEGYSDMSCTSWLDQPLTVAGRAVARTPARVEGRLVYLDRGLLTIPSLAIHQQRDVNRGHDCNVQKDMQPLYALGGSPSPTVLLAEELGVDTGDILATDLVLCPRQASVRIGSEGEFFQTPYIGDLDYAYTTLEGFLNTEGTERLGQLYCLFDNEEVGNGTRQGTMSSFLPDMLTRIEETLGLSAQARRQALAGNLLLPADNGHAAHLNFPEKADPANKVYPSGGVVIKYSTNQKYTTTGLTAGLFQVICQKAGVPVQVFANRADKPDGFTLGSLLGHQISTPVVDISMAQLTIHPVVRTAGSQDPECMARACAAFLQAKFTQTTDGVHQF